MVASIFARRPVPLPLMGRGLGVRVQTQDARCRRRTASCGPSPPTPPHEGWGAPVTSVSSADHGTASRRALRAASICALPRWLAWQMAMASASASSALSNLAFGSRKPTMAAIWRFSPWPVPVTVFLIDVGRILGHPQAALRRRQQGHAARLAELQGGARILVDEGLLDGRLQRLEAGDHLDQPLVDLAQAVGQVVLGVRRDQAAGHVGRAARRPTPGCPSRCGAGPDRCR